MKKIGFFLGRFHHAQKLIPIAKYAKGNELFDVEIVVADNAINIDPPTEFLSKYGIEEFHHSKLYQEAVPDKDVVEIVERVFNTSLIRSISPFWLAYSVREAIENISGFRGYIEANKPDGIFLLHGQNFWAKILAYQAHTIGLPVYTIQEGIILEREESDMGKYTWASEYITNIFSWSEYDRQFYGDPDIVVPTGPTHLDKWMALRKEKRKLMLLRHNLLSSIGLEPMMQTLSFSFPRLDLYKGNPIESLRKVGAWAVRNGYNVAVSLHPFQGNVPEINQIIRIYPNMSLWTGENAMELVSCVDAVLAQTGTLPLEAVALGVNVGEVNFAKMPLEQPLYKQGGAMLVEDEEDLKKLITGEVDADAIQEFREERLPLADGKSLQRLTEFVAND